VKRMAVSFALLAVLAVITGCNSSSTSPRVTDPPNGPTVLTVHDGNNGQTIVIHTGEQLRVVLSSTYWTFQRPTNEMVLSPHGETQVIPELSHCVPGGGCGTVVQMYDALAVGSTTVTASRTSCGEAMGCTSATSRFRVFTIVR